MSKAPELAHFEEYSAALMGALEAYGIEARQYGLGSISGTLPGGEPVEFITRTSFVEDDEEITVTHFRQPYIGGRMGGRAAARIESLQLLTLMLIEHHVDVTLGGESDPRYVSEALEIQGKVVDEATECLASQGHDALKARYGVNVPELDFISTFHEDLAGS